MNGVSERKNSRIMTLEFIRAIMTGVVFLSHMEFLANYSYGSVYTRFFHNATIGVDYFFLLSGFGLMASSYKSNSICEKSIGGGLRYGVGKIKGIYKPYIISMILMAPYVLYISIQDSGIVRGIIKTGIKFLSCGVMLQSLSGMLKFAHAFNGVGWFVSTIFVCYCLSPILMKISRYFFNGKTKTIIRLSITIAITAILRVLLMVVQERTVFDDISYSFPLIRVFYVLVGMSIYQLYVQRAASNSVNENRKRLGDLQELSAVILSVIWFLTRNTIELSLSNFFVYILDLATVSYLIYCFANECGMMSRVIKQSKVANLGKDMMYVYLYHYPIRIYTDLAFKKNRFILGEFTGIAEVILIFFLTLIVYKLYKRFTKKSMAGTKTG